MKKIILLTTLSLFVLACKKKDTDPETTGTAPAFALPHMVGTYWIYNWKKIGASGNETLLT